MSSNSSTTSLLPTWLETPPTSSVRPPVVTRGQELPFEELMWEDFEKLCLRLVRQESDVEYCQLYGVRGQKQHGIDIYARRKAKDTYVVYQCKNENNFGVTKIRAAIKRFREGKWFSKSDTFVLCTRESFTETKCADEVERQKQALQKDGVKLIPWDSAQLSSKLKEQPLIVDDFFGREWVKTFCGQEFANRLGKKLDAAQTAEFRHRLGAFYRHVFNNHDPGLPTLSSFGNETPLSIENRFVLPDIDELRTINNRQHFNEPQLNAEDDDLTSAVVEERRFLRRRRTIPLQRRTTSYEQRRPIEKWLAINLRSIILGGPGGGKSSLLRFLILDLLQDEPRLPSLAERWGQYLPIWVPFAFWTKKFAATETGDVSLSEALHGWLKSWNMETLWPLVEQALGDDRLLLFIDGLDEYTDETAAKGALSRLQVFIEQRNLPAVITSRPQGFERLGMQTAGWEVGTLSDFSAMQQEQLANIWFRHWARNTSEHRASSESDVESAVDKEVRDFTNDLKNSGDLRELAKVPLLLSLLIAHKLHHVQLPQSRFKAYDSLIDHLIITHPEKRRLAASLNASLFELTNEDLKAVLANLAFRVHEKLGEGIFDYEEAKSVIKDFLSNADDGFGLNASNARKISQQVLEIGENSLGILVKKTQVELGFFHRALQEYLAAIYLSTKDLSAQLELVEAKCVDPQWREVILGLLHIMNRPEDIKKLILQMKQRSYSTVERYAIDLLLSEIAFGDFKCGVTLARELAQTAFASVEIGSWMPQRERLVRHVLDGLRSTKVKDLVKSKLRVWFPDSTQWKRQKVFTEMAKWTRTPDVVECLWKGFYDEDPRNMRAAAKAFADLGRGDEVLGNRVAELAWSETDPEVRAAAIECLLRGWPQHESIKRVLTAARKSLHPVLRLAAIAGRIEKGERTEKDRRELFSLGSSEAGLDYFWHGEIAETIARGWPDSPEVKEDCFKAINKVRDNSALEKEIAEVVLLKGFPQDAAVAEYFANQMKADYFHPHYTFTLDDEKFFQILSSNFKDNPVLVPAVEHFLNRQISRDLLYNFEAALISNTSSIKSVLLSALNKYPHQVAPVLLKIWGMQDEDVKRELSLIALGSAFKASLIGKQIPAIIGDRRQARQRLLDILRDPDCRDTSAVLSGLIALGDTQDDTEVVDLVLKKQKGDEPLYEASRLIQGYSFDPRVRELAKKEFEYTFGSLDVIASVYSNDVEFRELLIEAVTPLPPILRMTIATKLGEGLADDDFTLSLLASYSREYDSQVKAQASISYHERLKAAGRNIETTIGVLEKDLVSHILDNQATMQSAFCGLVILKRLDVMKNAQLERTDLADRRIKITISEIGERATIPFLKILLQNWGYVKDVFGEEFWSRFASYDIKSAWKEICAFADEYSDPREEAIAFLESNKNDREMCSISVLGFLDRAMPKSRLLIEYCMLALERNSPNPHYISDEARYATELLGKHFTGDDEVLKRLMKLGIAQEPDSSDGKKVIPEKLIIALCEGWVKSEEFNQMCDLLSQSKQGLTYSTYFQLGSRAIPTDEFLRSLLDFLKRVDRSERLRSQMIARPLIRRLRKDDELLELLVARLQSSPSLTEKASFPRLIAIAKGATEVRQWCVEELERQTNGSVFPEVGLDLIEGRLRPVAHSLLDVLNLNVH